MNLDCSAGNVEPPANEIVRQSFAQQRKHLELAGGKIQRQRAVGFAVHASGKLIRIPHEDSFCGMVDDDVRYLM